MLNSVWGGGGGGGVGWTAPNLSKGGLELLSTVGGVRLLKGIAQCVSGGCTIEL